MSHPVAHQSEAVVGEDSVREVEGIGGFFDHFDKLFFGKYYHCFAVFSINETNTGPEILPKPLSIKFGRFLFPFYTIKFELTYLQTNMVMLVFVGLIIKFFNIILPNSSISPSMV